ncbi:MAG: histidine phosphatase family protein [Patescibacteria group bacterium]
MKENNIEKIIGGGIEKEPKLISTIFFIRHGASEYKEYTNVSNEELERDLLPKGEDQIKETASLVSSKINKDFPVRIITSGRVRAKQSADILKEGLIASGISVIPDKIHETKSFESTRFYGNSAEIFADLNNRYGKELENLWVNGKLTEDKVESFKDVTSRVKEAFIKSIRIFRKNNQGGHRDLSQIVLVSHGEVIDALFFGFGIGSFNDPERKLKNGGIVEIEIFTNNVVIKYDNKNYTLEI